MLKETGNLGLSITRKPAKKNNIEVSELPFRVAWGGIFSFRVGLRMPNKKWTREDIIESARRFSTRSEWKKGDSKAYSACCKRGWLNDSEVVGHMRSGYQKWTKPGMIESARQFSTRLDWQKGDPNAYQACRTRGWLNDPEITGHMSKRFRWEKPELVKSARKFRTRSEWQKGDLNAYSACCKRGWLNDSEITGHMVNPYREWDKPKLIKSARRFRTRGEWFKGEVSAYSACFKRGWMDDPEITGHMVKVREDWDKPKLIKSARKFSTRNEWVKGDYKAYQACSKRGWLNDPEITGHMEKVVEDWDKPKLIKSARRFSTRVEWVKGDKNAYQSCVNRGWIDDPEITGHMRCGLTKWTREDIIESARRFNTRGEWLNGDSNAYDACRHRGWMNDSDITGHMVAGDSASDNDAVYFYEFEYARTTLYKIGFTSIRLGDKRIKDVMGKAGCQPSNIFIWQVDNAREIEQKMLAVGTQQEFYRGDGSTEMRILTPEQVRRVLRIAQNASTGESQYLETI
jgi:hypothetical protein